MFGLRIPRDKKTIEVAGFPGRHMTCPTGKIFCCEEIRMSNCDNWSYLILRGNFGLKVLDRLTAFLF